MNDRGSISGRRRQEMFYNVILIFVRVTNVEVKKATCITYSRSVSVELGAQHAMRMRHILLSSVASPALKYFPTLSQIKQDFRGKKLLNIKFVFWFSLQQLSETFLILRRIQRVTVTNVQTSARKVSVILVRWTFSRDFRKISRYQISCNFVQWKPSSSMGTDGQTDGRDEYKSHFSQCW